VALAQVQGLERDGRLAGYHYLPAIKADLLRRLGRVDEAATAYREALELTGNQAEREFLTWRLADPGRPGDLASESPGQGQDDSPRSPA
jgi:predicted RNA polymerase sigma factor